MINLTAANAQGVISHAKSLRDTDGTGLLPVQAAIATGAPTFRLLGRVSVGAPWVEIKAPGTAAFLESFAWVPFIGVEVTAGVGSVNIFIGEK